MKGVLRNKPVAMWGRPLQCGGGLYNAGETSYTAGETSYNVGLGADAGAGAGAGGHAKGYVGLHIQHHTNHMGCMLQAKVCLTSRFEKTKGVRCDNAGLTDPICPYESCPKFHHRVSFVSRPDASGTEMLAPV